MSGASILIAPGQARVHTFATPADWCSRVGRSFGFGVSVLLPTEVYVAALPYLGIYFTLDDPYRQLYEISRTYSCLSTLGGRDDLHAGAIFSRSRNGSWVPLPRAPIGTVGL